MIAGAAAAIDPSKLASAVQEATREIDAAGLGAGDRAETARFFASLDRNLAQVIAQLPRDLFAPRAARRQASHDVALPGGGAGAVSVSFTAAADPASGVTREAEREIVTDLGGDRRLTVESWQLKPL